MAILQKFHSIHIDVDKGIFEVNGRNISQSGKEIHLTFEDGIWSLVVSEDTIYTSDQRITE